MHDCELTIDELKDFFINNVKKRKSKIHPKIKIERKINLNAEIKKCFGKIGGIQNIGMNWNPNK